MARCRCSSEQCVCSLVAGTGISVTGAGSPTSPWVVTNTGDGGGGGGSGGPVTIADLPAGSVIDSFQSSTGTWSARPTARTDVRVNWVGYPGLVSLPSGGLAGRDSYVKRTT
jgi:hypothetical protein